MTTNSESPNEHIRIICMGGCPDDDTAMFSVETPHRCLRCGASTKTLSYADYAAQAERIAQQDKRIASLRRRLEVDRLTVYDIVGGEIVGQREIECEDDDFDTDGIACRDTTIAHLDSQVAQLRAERDTAQSELHNARESARNALAATEKSRDGWKQRAQTAESELAAAQAKIDSLMLEYCPDEMSDEQFQNWASHQRRASPEEEAAINAAIAARTPDAGKENE